ncbi:MAG: hypothetical protein KAI99_22155, partial [Cyclobacteriaceae bacterium]|nr:hypothetical protein [Cyclobacteriaceae bacterium]
MPQTLATGMSIPEAAASKSIQSISQELAMESLLSQYLQCLGGPFPEPSPLLTQQLDSIQKDGYRIES